MEGAEDGIELGIVVASDELTDHGEEKGDLHVNLGKVVAIESAVELGFFKGGNGAVFAIEESIFVSNDRGRRGDVFVVFVFGGVEIAAKLSDRTGKSAGERVVNRAELGRFEAAIVAGDEATDVVHAEIEVAGEIGGFVTAIVHDGANAEEGDKDDNGADKKLEYETAGNAFGGFLGGLGRLRNAVEILKFVHVLIIA